MRTRRHILASAIIAVTVVLYASLDATADAAHGPAAARELPAPTRLRAVAVRPGLVRLRWARVSGARSYRVERSGGARWTVRRGTLADRTVSPATSYGYRVRAVGSDGVAGVATTMLPVTTRAGGSCDWLATPDGSNLASGRLDDPVRTIQRLADLTHAGEVGCARGRFTGDVTFHHAGTASAPVVLRSVHGTRATIRGRMWIPDDTPHVIVQDVNLDGRNLDGGELPSPTIEGDGSMLLHDDITNHRHHICVILGSLHGYGAARGVVIDSSRIHDCGRRPTNNEHHGVYVENAYGTRITNNVLWQNQSRGIQLYPNAQGSYIARNVIVANGEGVIFSGNHGHASSRNRVVDNLIAHSRTRYDIEHWWPVGNPIGSGNVAARNCVWGGHDGTIINPPVGFAARSNFVARPIFRDLAHGDLRAAAGSQCAWLQTRTLPLRPFS